MGIFSDLSILQELQLAKRKEKNPVKPKANNETRMRLL